MRHRRNEIRKRVLILNSNKKAKNYFKGLCIGILGAIAVSQGIIILLEVVQGGILKMDMMAKSKAINVLSYIIDGVTGTALTSSGIYIIYKGAKKAELLSVTKKRKKIHIKYCPKYKKNR